VWISQTELTDGIGSVYVNVYVDGTAGRGTLFWRKHLQLLSGTAAAYDKRRVTPPRGPVYVNVYVNAPAPVHPPLPFKTALTYTKSLCNQIFSRRTE
jgi:hypothetical protein